ncbi:MAG: hypothetical protein FWF29_02335 [Treponema sp.]|nr:hypothetical protein [Treponema sp.]
MQVSYTNGGPVTLLRDSRIQ